MYRYIIGLYILCGIGLHLYSSEKLHRIIISIEVKLVEKEYANYAFENKCDS